MQRPLALVIRGHRQAACASTRIGDIGKCRGRESDQHRSEYGPKFHACYLPFEIRDEGVWRQALMLGKHAGC